MGDNESVNGGKIEIKVPLEQWVRDIAHEVAEQTVRQSIKSGTYPIRQTLELAKANAEAIEKLRMRFIALVAFMIGSGVLGGLAARLMAG